MTDYINHSRSHEEEGEEEKTLESSLETVAVAADKNQQTSTMKMTHDSNANIHTKDNFNEKRKDGEVGDSNSDSNSDNHDKEDEVLDLFRGGDHTSETPIFGIDTLSNSTPNENPNQRLPTNENINSISTLDPTIMVVNPPHHHPIRWTTITVMGMTMSMPQMQIQMQMSMHHHPQQQRQILHSNQAIMSFDGKS